MRKFYRLKCKKLNNRIQHLVMLVITLAITAAFLCSCTLPDYRTSDTDGNGKIQVLCTDFPQYDWARNIIGRTDKIELSMLFKNGADAHSYQPSANDIIRITHSELLIYNGGASDKSIEDILDSSAQKTDRFSCMNIVSDSILNEDDLHIEHGHDHEHELEHQHSHEHHHNDGESADNEDYDESDEHIWLSIKRVQRICAALGEKFAQIDPDNAETYRTNANIYCMILDALDGEYTQTVNSAKNNNIIVADRFPFLYLAKDYGLNCHAAFPGCSAETEASFKTVVSLANELDELNLSYIVTTDNPTSETASAVIKASGRTDVQTVTLNSLQGVTDNDISNGLTYISAMTQNLDVLKRVLN